MFAEFLLVSYLVGAHAHDRNHIENYNSNAGTKRFTVPHTCVESAVAVVATRNYHLFWN